MKNTTSVHADFDALPEDCRVLIESESLSFDQSLPWLKSMAAHILGPQEELRVICVRDSESDRVLAVLPARLSRRSTSLYEFRRLDGLANFYTTHFAPIIAQDADVGELASALAHALVAADGGNWQTLDLNPMDVDAPLFGALAAALRERGCFVQPYFRFGNWRVGVEGRTFDEYMQSLSSRVTNSVRRKARKLDRSAQTDIEVIQGTQGLDDALDAYDRIYAMSWKQAEPYPQFIRDFVTRFAERGWLRMGLIKVNGSPVAAQLWFVYRGTASIFKLAYDPAFAKQSVGSILTMRLMRQVIDVDRVEVVDYLSGDDAYKRDWMSDRGERWGLRAYRTDSLAGMAGVARVFLGRVKPLLRFGRKGRSPAGPDWS